MRPYYDSLSDEIEFFSSTFCIFKNVLQGLSHLQGLQHTCWEVNKNRLRKYTIWYLMSRIVIIIANLFTGGEYSVPWKTNILYWYFSFVFLRSVWIMDCNLNDYFIFFVITGRLAAQFFVSSLVLFTKSSTLGFKLFSSLSLITTFCIPVLNFPVVLITLYCLQFFFLVGFCLCMFGGSQFEAKML